MNFFDSVIDKVNNTVYEFSQKSLCENTEKLWRENSHSCVLMLRDTAFELKGVGFNLVTQRELSDSICLVGKDLYEINGDSRFTRACFISIEPQEDEQSLYNLIKKIEYVKYRFFPEGYMIRSASDAQKESVRVSRDAIKNGISFEKIGSLLIKKFKEIPGVKAVKVLFITDENVDYKALASIAKKSDGITKALNHIMNSVQFDCDSCGLKAICDEVEGMKEMHFKTAEKNN